MPTAVATTDELQPGERLFVEVKGTELAVLNVDGEVYAIQNFCPHMEGPVGRGPTGEDANGHPTIRCPFHDWQFDLVTGETYTGNRKRLVTYDVEIVDGEVVVDL